MSDITEISLILPTRNRPFLVRRLLDSIVETTSNLGAIEIVLCMDEGCVDASNVDHGAISIRRLVGRWQGMGDIYRTCYAEISSPYFMLINDDMIFRTKNWDIKTMQALSCFPDGLALVYTNDLYYGEKLSSFPAMSRTTCDLMGGISPPQYRGHCIDSHIFDVFERLASLGHERRKYLPDVICEHMHYGVSVAAYDRRASGPGGSEDYAMYSALAEDRQQTALKMVQFIESQARSTTAPPTPSVSIMMWGCDGQTQSALACLTSIHDDNNMRPLDYRITLLSNGSLTAEDIASLPDRLRDRITLVHCKDTAVLCRAMDITADYHVFLSGPCMLRAGWLAALVACAEDDGVGVVGSKCLNSRSGRIEHAGLSFFDDEGTIKSTYIYKGLVETHPAVSRTRDLQAVAMTGMLVKKACLTEACRRLENATGWEGLRICLAAKELGKRVVYSPKAGLLQCPQETMHIAPDNPEDQEHLPPNLQEQVECDLEQMLSEDGIALHKSSRGHYVCLAEKPGCNAAWAGDGQ